MKVLGIDTSTSCGSVGFIDEEKDILFEYSLKVPITHSERLLKAIDHVLNITGYNLEDIDGFAISLGPGSFTGLRIGVSTIKGLSFATKKAVLGIPSLDVLASQISPTPYLICPIIDGRKGEVYTAFYYYTEENQLQRLTPYKSIKPEELIKGIERKTMFIGDGVKSYKEIIKNYLSSLALFTIEPLNNPFGTIVAKLGCNLLRKGEVLTLDSFTPMYIRAPEAETKWLEKNDN